MFSLFIPEFFQFEVIRNLLFHISSKIYWQCTSVHKSYGLFPNVAASIEQILARKLSSVPLEIISINVVF